MIKGEVWISSGKKLGQTRPPHSSSSLAAVSSPSTFPTRNINAPFHAGHTGNRANFCMLEIVRRGLLVLEGGAVDSSSWGMVEVAKCGNGRNAMFV